MPILRLIPEDAEDYRALRFESLREDPLGYASALEDEADHPIGWFAEMLGRNAVFVAKGEGGEWAGMLGFRVDGMHRRRHVGYIWGMYVRRPQRGRGLGAALMAAAMAHAQTRVSIIQLAVGAANKGAIGLYERSGFSIYGTEIGTLMREGVAFDSHLMVRHLG